MPRPVIRVENLSKQYRLGTISHRTLTKDAQRWWASLRGHEDPNAQLSSDFVGDSAKPRSTSNDSDRFLALDDVSFDVLEGEVLGVVGGNGAGKSTLLKILSRVTTPTRGTVKIRGRVASLLEVGTGFHPELTGRENIFLNGAILGMSNAETRAKFDEIIDFSGIDAFVDTPVKRYSSGMYVRLAFAVAAHLDPEILIVDEVLAVGDEAFRRKCMGKMQDVAQGGRTVLFVSHNMPTIRRLCSRGILMERGRVAMCGSAAEVTERYHQSLESSVQNRNGLAAGVLFDEPEAAFEDGCAITGVRMFDEQGQPKSTIKTWDWVRFKIDFRSERDIERGSVVFRVATRDGVALSLTSTTPDCSVPCHIREGEQSADCIYLRWPFSEGDYVIGAGLAITGVQMIGWQESLCEIKTDEQDVYQSGLAPSSSRYLVATEVEWQVPSVSK